MTGFNIRYENDIHESILFGFPGISNEAVIITYFILHPKHYIYLEKLKEDNKTNVFNVDFLEYLCHFKYKLKIEKILVLKNK